MERLAKIRKRGPESGFDKYAYMNPAHTAHTPQSANKKGQHGYCRSPALGEEPAGERASLRTAVLIEDKPQPESNYAGRWRS